MYVSQTTEHKTVLLKDGTIRERLHARYPALLLKETALLQMAVLDLWVEH